MYRSREKDWIPPPAVDRTAVNRDVLTVIHRRGFSRAGATLPDSGGCAAARAGGCAAPAALSPPPAFAASCRCAGGGGVLDGSGPNSHCQASMMAI